MVPRIIIINGPNLNLLGKRDPELYGGRSMEEYLHDMREKHPLVQVEYLQTNHEGQIIDWLHGFGFHVDGIVINAGGYAHSSVAIRDAIEVIPCPVVDVHISNIYEREDFRHVNMLKDNCIASIVGQGLDGYELAVLKILERLEEFSE